MRSPSEPARRPRSLRGPPLLVLDQQPPVWSPPSSSLTRTASGRLIPGNQKRKRRFGRAPAPPPRKKSYRLRNLRRAPNPLLTVPRLARASIQASLGSKTDETHVPEIAVPLRARR